MQNDWYILNLISSIYHAIIKILNHRRFKVIEVFENLLKIIKRHNSENIIIKFQFIDFYISKTVRISNIFKQRIQNIIGSVKNSTF